MKHVDPSDAASLLKSLNRQLLEGDDESYLAGCSRLLSERPDLWDVLRPTFAFARRRRRLKRRGVAPAIVVFGSDLTHEAVRRMRTLADLYAAASGGHVRLIGPVFAGEEPRAAAVGAGGGGPVDTFHVPGELDFPARALDLVSARPADVVHLAGPSLPAVLIGLLYKTIWDAAVFIDVREADPEAPCRNADGDLHASLSAKGTWERLEGIRGAEWTRLASGLADLFDGVSSVNVALRERFGGVLIPPVTAACDVPPSPERRWSERARLGLPEDATLVAVLAAGRHGEETLTAMRALARLGRPDLVLVPTGEIDERMSRAALATSEGVSVRLPPPGSLDHAARVAAVADACLVLEGEPSPRAGSRTPEGLVEALAAGVPVLAEPMPGIAEIVSAGAAVPVAPETLAATLELFLGSPQEARKAGLAGRHLFETAYPHGVGLAGLRALFENRSDPRSPMAHAPLEDRRQHRLFEALGGWGALRSGPRRIVVYTVATGGTTPRMPLLPDDRVRYMAFTDDPDLDASGWEVVHIDTPGLAPEQVASLPKMLPHLYLPRHDISVYVDPRLVLMEPDVTRFAEAVLDGADLAALPHSKRQCFYAEIETALEIDKADRKALAKRFRKEKYPQNWGLLEDVFLVRRNTPAMRRVNGIWLEESLAGGHRDDFYFMYALWLTQVPFATLGDGTSVRTSPALRLERSLDRARRGHGRLAAENAAVLADLAAPDVRALVARAETLLSEIADAAPDAAEEKWEALIDTIVWLDFRRSAAGHRYRARLARLLFSDGVAGRGRAAGGGVAYVTGTAGPDGQTGREVEAALAPAGIALTHYGPQDTDVAAGHEWQEARRLTLAALADRRELLVTPDPRVAVCACLADFPTVIDLRQHLDPNDVKIDFLARSAAIEAILTRETRLGERFAASFRGIAGRIVPCADARESAGQILRIATRRPDLDCGTGEVAIGPVSAVEDDKPTVRWIFGSDKQRGWAYGINAQRLSGRIRSCRFVGVDVDGDVPVPVDVAIAFDVLIKRGKDFRHCAARRRIMRAGGPNPFFVLSGGRDELVREEVADLDAIIALSPQLRDELSELHPHVYFIPNGIDLVEWRPDRREPKRSPGFTIGLCASLEDETQRQTKGLHIAEEAAELAGVELLVVGRGARQLSHEDLIPEFYSQIDVLIHPVDAGKEASSNVIMEALALGVPVVTTRHAGFHGAALEPGVEAIVTRRTPHDFAEAIADLRGDRAYRQSMSAAGRRFAERHHALDVVAGKYERVIWSCLSDG